MGEKRMNQKYASPVACLTKTSYLIRSLRDDERVISQETRICKWSTFTTRANGHSLCH